MNRTKIEWCDYTWNPIVGCKTGCKYCYAERINKRFKHIPDWKKPEFFPERLTDPLDKKAATIFVGSMCDLFGGWIPSEWIWQIMEVVHLCDQHQFMFLTKYPLRYNEFEFPPNAWIGATIEQADEKGMQRLYDIDDVETSAKKFLSIEPLLGDFYALKLSHFDLLIIGAMTGPGAIVPQKEWIESIRNDNILIKNNAKKYLK